MLATRWEPMSEMNRLRDEMDRLFGRYNQTRRNGVTAFPPMNLWEDENRFYLEAELPGFGLDDLEIYVTSGNQLSLKGERKPPELEKGTWHRQERGFGSFNRTVELPGTVDSDNVTAEFKHGVLTVSLGKSAEVKPRRIEVKTS